MTSNQGVADSTSAGDAIFIFMKIYNNWVKENCSSLKGKTVCISGASGSIGYYIAYYCLVLEAKLIFAVRNIERAKKSIKNLTKNFPNADIKIIYVDYEKLDSLNPFINEIKNTKVDYFVNNAGIYLTKEELIEHDLERLFCINYLSQYYLVSKLADYIKSRNGKIVSTSSISIYFKGSLDLSNFQNRNINRPLKRYSFSKKDGAYSLMYLKNKYNNFDIAHPGVTYSGLFLSIENHVPKFIAFFIRNLSKIIFMSNSKASLSIIYALTHELQYGEWVGPRGLFQFWGMPKVFKLRKKYLDNEMQKEIINKTNSLINNIGLK